MNGWERSVQSWARIRFLSKIQWKHTPGEILSANLAPQQILNYLVIVQIILLWRQGSVLFVTLCLIMEVLQPWAAQRGAAPSHLKSHLTEPKATLPLAMYHLAVEFTFFTRWADGSWEAVVVICSIWQDIITDYHVCHHLSWERQNSEVSGPLGPPSDHTLVSEWNNDGAGNQCLDHCCHW